MSRGLVVHPPCTQHSSLERVHSALQGRGEACRAELRGATGLCDEEITAALLRLDADGRLVSRSTAVHTVYFGVLS